MYKEPTKSLESVIYAKVLKLRQQLVSHQTRKPCYRKENRAMRPIYGCSEKFLESLATPMVTFPEIVNGLFRKIFNGLLFAWALRMYRPNLKSVALPVPEIIRGT